MLYDEFIENKSTKETMESSDYFGLLNILMQVIISHAQISLTMRKTDINLSEPLSDYEEFI